MICDRCGKDLCADEEYSAWNDSGYIRDMAQEEDWIQHEGEDICDDCYCYNDNDELEINDKRIKIYLRNE